MTELRDDPRRRKGAKVPEVAAALADLAHDMLRHELVFRVTGWFPAPPSWAARCSAASWRRSLTDRRPKAEPTAAPLVIGEYDSVDPLVVRTDFTDDDAWSWVAEELRKPWMDNEPVPYLISDPAYAGASAEQVLRTSARLCPTPNCRGGLRRRQRHDARG
ncbi:hypothetical protein NKH77_00645 [Streptomyces sp. M19]